MGTSLRFALLILAHSAYMTGASPQFGGGGGFAGGFSQVFDHGSDPEVGHVMDFIASEIKYGMFQGDDACSIEVDNVKKVERQVVAGTNYRVNVHLKSSCVIPGGAGEAVIKCRKLKVFVPLPVNCNNPNPDNPKCAELTVPDVSEKCSSDGYVPSPPEFLVGGYDDATGDENLNDVLDFAKIEAKNSLLHKYGSDNCVVELDNLGRAESQLVAGMNYRMTFSLKSICALPRGSNRINISCEEVVVYMPLEVYCENPNYQNPKCMDMSERMEEKCNVTLQ